MANVLRHDVVKISFEINNSPLAKVAKQAESVKNKFKGLSGDEAFKKLRDNAKKVLSPLQNVSNSLKKCSANVKKFLTSLKTVDIKNLKELDKKLTTITSKLGKGLVNAAKKAAKAILAVGTGLGVIVKQAVSAFADREQLVGGVETLFKDNAGTVQKYANDAYKTSGLSANEYMETVTSFSASLLQSLGGDTAKAADYAQLAIVDMSDNANKMGTDMGLIQNAYQGFAKQNYTMLDNLKLGYGGTKEEMQRLLKDAEKISGQKFDLSSYADVVQAIHVIQTEMDITGTTAKEASNTISGSLNAMKSAWSNLLPAFVQGGDSLNQCIDNLISSAKIFAGNVMPAIDSALTNILSRLGPVGKTIQNVIDKIKGIGKNSEKLNLLGNVGESLKTTFETIVEVVGKLIEKFIDFATCEKTLNTVKTVLDSVKSVISGVANHLNIIIPLVKTFGIAFLTVVAVVKTTTMALSAYNAIVTTIKAAQMIATGATIADTIAKQGNTAATWGGIVAAKAYAAAQWIMNASLYGCPLVWIIAAIVALIAIIVVCVKYWDKIKEAAVKCWEAIKNAWGKVSEWFNTTVIQPIKNFFTGLWNGIKSIFSSVINWIKENFISIIAFIINPFAGIFSYLYNNFEGFRNVVNNIVNAIKGFFTNLFYFVVGIFTYVKEFICSIWGAIASWVNTNVIQPIVNFFRGLWTAIIGIVTSVWNTICVGWGIIASWVNTNVIQPIVNFFTSLWNSITNIVTSIWNTICTIWGTIASWVNSNIIQPIINFFTSLWSSITNIVTSIFNTICSVWGAITGWISANVIEPIKSFFTGLWNGISSGVSSVKEAITGAFSAAYEKVVSIWEGITGFFKGIWDGIKGVVNKLISKGKEALGVESDVKSKGTKHAWGGLMTTPHWGVVAEDGPEMIIPLSKDKRGRALSLWKQAGEILRTNQTTNLDLGNYTPNSSGTYTTNNNGGDTYSPTFNLTINNTGNDRDIEYKVKKWVREGMEEVARGLSRRNPKLQET